jgi:hypothetical protein
VVSNSYHLLRIGDCFSPPRHDFFSLDAGALIEWLCEEGISRYDMGSVLDYKLHWTELELKSHTLVWRPNW